MMYVTPAYSVREWVRRAWFGLVVGGLVSLFFIAAIVVAVKCK